MLIDLAGSESPTGNPDSDSFKEGKAINDSLMNLGILFREMKTASDELTGKSCKFVKFIQDAIKRHRQKKLVMVAHLSPEEDHQLATVQTLQRALEASEVGTQMARPMARPVAQQLTRPVTQPMVRPFAQPLARPFAQPMQRPVAQPTIRPVAQPIHRPVAQPMIRPVMASGPVAKPATREATQQKQQRK